jgi:hypothetical protein
MDGSIKTGQAGQNGTDWVTIASHTNRRLRKRRSRFGRVPEGAAAGRQPVDPVRLSWNRSHDLTGFGRKTIEHKPVLRVIAEREINMAKHSDLGIGLDKKPQQHPKDKDRARTATKTEPGHMPQQDNTQEDDELQPLREKSGF